MRQVTILIVTRNKATHLPATLRSIQETTRYPWRMVLIDVESNDGTAEICDEFASLDPRIEVRHEKDKGSAMEIINNAVKSIKTGDIYLTHDDCIYPQLYMNDWLGIMTDYAGYKDVGCVTCIGGGSTSGPEYLEGFHWVGTWSLYLKRECLDVVAEKELLDMKFFPGMGDDVDLTYRIIQSGFKIAEAPFWVQHHRLGMNPRS